MLGELGVEICFVPVDILPLETDRGGDIEIVKKVCDVEENRVSRLAQCEPQDHQFNERHSYLRYSKQLKRHSTTVKCTLLYFNLLETKLILLRIEVVEARPVPLLIFLRVIFLQANNVLGHLFEHLCLKGTLGLA